jgi:probable DNA repair protein
LLDDGKRFSDCVSVEQWMAGLWSRLQLFSLIDDRRAIIDSGAMSALWIQFAGEISTLSAPECVRVAHLADEAWTLAVRHDFPLRGLSALASGDDDVAFFAACAARMQRRLTERNALSPAQLPQALAAHCRVLRPYLPSRIVLTPAFSSDPAMNRLWTTLRDFGVDVSEASDSSLLPAGGASPGVIACADRRQEIAAALDWAQARLASQPEATVALIVPDLAMHRATWRRALRARFNADNWWGDPATDRDRFNLSFGDTLDTVPHVACLLVLLRASTAQGATETIAQSLLHPRWGRTVTAQQAIARRQVELLDRGIDQSTLADWVEVLGPTLASTLPAPLSGRGSVRPASRAAHRQRLHSMIAALTATTSLYRSDLFQLDEAWLQLLDRWQQFDHWLNPVDWPAAVSELGRLAAQTSFQPKAGVARLQVIGLLESAGVPLDAARIVGLNDRVLPERLKPNPMLPRAWQASRHVGLGSADEVDARAARLWRNWLDLCRELTVSFARDDDGTALRLSPLATHLPLQQAGPATAQPPVASDPAVADEYIADEQLPVRPALPGDKPLSARALEDQAHCPRRSASERLNLTQWPEHAVGIPARVRGTLVHAVLAPIGSARLSAPGGRNPEFSDGHLLAVARRALDELMAQHSALRPRVPDLVWRIEHSRVMALVEKVLHLEATRAGFAVVAVEAEVRARDFEQDFRVRVDRVDQAHGSGTPFRVVFDYKTGKVTRGDWFADGSSGRLAAPQLPLYALLLSQTVDQAPVRALGYIVVGDDSDPKFVGVGEDPAIASAKAAKNDPTWDDLSSAWRGQLSSLVRELQQGIADVAPLKGRTTCRHCAFAAFCREPWSLASEQVDIADADALASEPTDV